MTTDDREQLAANIQRRAGNRNDAVEKLRSAREDLEDYSRHQRERGGLDVDETPEYYRLNTRVSEARRNVSWWRR